MNRQFTEKYKHETMLSLTLNKKCKLNQPCEVGKNPKV